MAKALLGHVGGPDLRLVDEVRRLRTRVRDLETELARVTATNDTLMSAVHVEDDLRFLTLDDEPALT